MLRASLKVSAWVIKSSIYYCECSSHVSTFQLDEAAQIGEYLLGIFLMNIEFRKFFNIPTPEKVSFSRVTSDS